MEDSQPAENHLDPSTTEQKDEHQHKEHVTIVDVHENHFDGMSEQPGPENHDQHTDHEPHSLGPTEEPTPSELDLDITSRKLHTDDEPVQVSTDAVEDHHSVHNAEDEAQPAQEEGPITRPTSPHERPVVQSDGAMEQTTVEDAGGGVAYEIVFEEKPKSADDKADSSSVKVIEHHSDDHEQQQLDESVEESHNDEIAEDFAEPKIEPDILVIEHPAEAPESHDEELHASPRQEDEIFPLAAQAFLTESKSSGELKAYNEIQNHQQTEDAFDSAESAGMKSSVSFGAGESDVLRAVKDGVRRKPAPQQNNIRRTMPHLNNYRRNLWGQQQQQQQKQLEVDHRSRRTKSQSPGRLFKDIAPADPADTELLRMNAAKYSDLRALFGDQKEPDEWMKRRQAEIRSRLEHEQREMAAKEARRQEAEEAYKGWLQKKAKERRRAQSHGRDRQPSNEETNERRKNREEAEVAFKVEAWLEKKKEEQRERLKRLQQQQTMEKDNARPNKEDVDQAYRTWTQQKLKQKREQRLLMQAQIKELGNIIPLNYQNFNGNRFPMRSNNNGTYYGLPPVNNNSQIRRISPNNVSKKTKKRVLRSDSLPSIANGGQAQSPSPAQ